MQKINIKNTTKATMYAMLCAADKKCEELEDSYRQLEADSMKRIDQLNDNLAEAIKESNGFKELAEKQNKLLAEARVEMDNCLANVRWVNEHPWKHLWWCLRGKNK